MFGSLKKKLQSAIAKVTGRIEAKEKPVEKLAEQPAEIKIDVAELEPMREEIREETAEPFAEETKGEPVYKQTDQLDEEILKAEKAAEYESVKDELREFPAELKEADEEIREKKERIEPEIRIEKRERVLPEVGEEIISPKIVPITEIEVPSEKPKEEKRGFFKRLVEKTLTEDDIQDILKELEIALLENDVAVEVAEKIGVEVKSSLLGQSVRRGGAEEVIKTALRSAMLKVLGQEPIDLEQRIAAKDGPFVITIVGFNGAGKTTTLAKLAHHLSRFGPIFAAGDTFRAASIEQLEEHGRRLGVEVVKHRYGADSAAVIFDARKHAEAIGAKLVLADTAGRSHANTNLMDELAKVIRVNKPDLKILVLDALTGNDIYDQANMFDKSVGVDAIILTKADVYEKGGAALSAAYALQKPILFLGVGQEYGDLQPFDPKKIVDSLLE